MNERRVAVGREEWAKRVERWRDGGLTAKEFAAELGINAGSFAAVGAPTHQLKKGAVLGKRETVEHQPAPRSVEVTPPVAVPQGFDVRIGRFTVAVPGGLVPYQFPNHATSLGTAQRLANNPQRATGTSLQRGTPKKEAVTSRLPETFQKATTYQGLCRRSLDY